MAQPLFRAPIPAIQPYRETEADPPCDFRDWLIKFDLYLELLQEQQPRQDGQAPPDLPDSMKIRYLALNLGNYALRSFSKDPIYTQRRDGDMTYQRFLNGAKRHFQPPATRCKARFEFHRRVQEAGETVDEYLTALRTMALDCQFPDDDRISEEILNQLIEGTCDIRTQQELLAMDDLTLNRALGIMRANEAAKSASAAMRTSGMMEVKAINKGRGGNRRGGQQRTQTRQQQPATGSSGIMGCMGCGSLNHKFGDNKCPAKNLNCRFCGKKGHMERVCMVKRRGSGQQGGRGRAITTGGVTVQDVDLNQVREKDMDNTDHFVAEFYLANGQGMWVPLKMEVDSGAQPSIIPYSWYQRHLTTIPLKIHQRQLRNYDGSLMGGIRGTISTKVLFGGREQRLQFYIREGPHKPIAGRNLLCSLQVHIQATLDGATVVNTVKTEEVLQQFPKLLSEELGTYPGKKHHIHLKKDVSPRVTALRQIPLARQEAVKKEIELMDQTGIWEPVEQSEWAHPLVTVPKSDGGVRITTDLTGLNTYVIPARYPLPRIKDLFLRFTGATLFSKLDLRRGYFHIPLTEDSKDLTTTITPLGLRRYNRLPMGLTDAASAFQQRIHQTLQGLPGVVVYIDDILVYGKTAEEHDRNLLAVLKRLEENDFRLQLKKCVFQAKEVPAFGHILSTEGIRPDPKNLQPILDATPPASVKEVQSFLGIVNYYNDFLPNLAELAEPLRRLTRKDQDFLWTPDCQNGFEKLKKAIVKVAKLSLFNPEATTIVTTDASDVGMGAVLIQIQNGHEVPIAFFNKTLSTTERNYATTEKEALAVLKACEHWENLLLGQHFTLRTDHQALTRLLTNPKNTRQSAKFQRWFLRLSEFDYDVQHIPGSTNRIADYLSRTTTEESDTAVWGILCDDLQRATMEDETLQKVKDFVLSQWPRTKQLDDTLKSYAKVANQLQWKDGLLWKLHRIIVPETQRQAVIKEVHRGHPGVERMKRIFRATYWWPLADRYIQRKIDQCEGCQRSQKTKSTTSIPTTRIPTPTEAGRQYAVDITGPFANGRYIVAMIDYYSHFPEILDTKTTTSNNIIAWLTDVFDRTGNPEALLTDNGPQFVSREFEKFLKERDIFHYRTSVYNPQENGLIESFNRYLKYGIQAFLADGTQWITGLRDLIASYRAIPLEGGKSPAELFMGRPIRFQVTPNVSKPIRRTSAISKKTLIQASNTQGKNYFGPSLYQRGQQVLTKLPHVPKGYSPYSQPKTVQQVLGYYTYLLSDGQFWNARMMKPYKHWTPYHLDDCDQNVNPAQLSFRTCLGRPQRSRRQDRLEDGLTPYFQPRANNRRKQPPGRYVPETGHSE